jgi:hypothetical protein
MGAHREHRLDTELNRLLDDLSRPDSDRAADVPGKRTRVQQLVEQLTAQRGPEHASTPGRRTLVERLVAMAGSLAFDQFRVQALRDVLGAIGGRAQLHDATVAAADPEVARRAIPPERMRQATADADGHAMWRAAERRAGTLYRRAFDAGEVSVEDPEVEAAIARAGSGTALPATVRRKMEDELGVPLARVRVHTDAVADRAARALRAEAFTVGEDIFFASGMFAPESREGQKLLAHELTHVVQGWQGKGGGERRVSQPHDSLEQEADVVAEKVAARIDGAGEGDRERRANARPDGKRGEATPGPEARPTATDVQPGATGSRTVQRKADRQAPRALPEHASTIRPTFRARLQRTQSPNAATGVDRTFSSHLEAAGHKARAAFKPLHAGVAHAKSVKIGAKAAAKGKHEKQQVDHHIRAQHDHAAKHHADAAAHKKAKHDDPTGVPPPPKLDPHSPIQFKKVTDWAKYMPPPMPDQDERERKHILALVKNKIIGEQAESQKVLGKLHADQVAAAAAIRKMKPGLQAQIANGQKAAIGQVASAEATQAAAVAGAYAAAQGKVRGAGASARSQVSSAYSETVSAINDAYRTNDDKLTKDRDDTKKAVDEMEQAQLVAIATAYASARSAVDTAATSEAAHARSLADSVSLPYDGDKLDAAKEAAHKVANGWADEIPGKMREDAGNQIFNHESESKTGTTDYAKQQRQQADDLYKALKEALDTAHKQALEGAGKAKDQALQQIDSMVASTCASLAAQSAAQVASVHQQAANARTGINKAAKDAIAGVIAACDKTAKGLDGGAAGLVAGAKLVEAPDPEFTAQKVAEGEKLLKSGTTSAVDGLKKSAAESARGLTQQAAEAAKGMAAVAAAARQAADKAAQGASQSLGKIASGTVASLHKMQEGFTKQANDIGSKADEKFQGIVNDTRNAFTDGMTKLNKGLTDAVNGLQKNYRSSIDDGETKQILEEAKKAADAVKPWWQKALAVVCEILVVIVIMVAVTVLTAGLGTGLVAVGIGILAGAAAGAASSIASQVVGNLIMGEPAFNIDWKEVGISALAGAITGGIASGLGEFGGATVGAAMKGATGFGNYAIRFGVNAGAGMAGDIGAHYAFDGHYSLDMKNLAITLGTAAVMSHSKAVGLQNRLGDRFRASVGRPPIHGADIETSVGGHSEGGGSSAHPDVGGPGGHPDVGGPGGSHPETGGGGKPAGHDTGGGGKPAGHDTGGGQPAGHDTGGGGKPPGTETGGGKPAGHDEGGGGKPAGHDEAGGGKPPRPDEGGGKPAGHDEGGGKPPRPDEGGGTKPDEGGGKPPRPDEGGGKPAGHDEAGGGKPAGHDEGGGGKPAGHDEGGGGKPAGHDEAGGGKPAGHDEAGGGKPAGHDEAGGGKPPKPDDGGGKPAGHDEGGGKPGHDEGGGKPGHDEGGGKPGHDEHGGKPGDERSPEQQAHDAERDAIMNEDGYVEGTRAKADETAAEVEKGGSPKKDGLRDTEANARGREDLEKLKDPRVTPEDRQAIDRDVANRLRGKSDPTGKLDADVKAATDKVAADHAARGDGPGGKPGSEPGGKPGAGKEPESGLTPEKIDEIRNTPKGQRPDPKDYLNPEYVKAQLAKFEDGGASRIMPERNFSRFGPGQKDGTSFVMPKNEVDALLASAHGDPRLLEKVLGLEPGFLDSGGLVRVDVPEPNRFGLRVPSGNEAGANDLWLPGGKLPTGATEGIVDVPAMKEGVDFTDHPIKVNPPKSDPGASTPKGLTDTAPTTGPKDTTPTDTTPTGGRDTTPSGGRDTTPSGVTDTTPTGPKPPTGKEPTPPTTGKDPTTPTGDDGRARGITTGDGPSGLSGERGNQGPMRSEQTSLDGFRVNTEFTELSGRAQHFVRQLERNGWVRTDDIRPEELAEVSRWFGREIGVLQNPATGRLRIVLGTRNGVLTRQLKPGEIFLVHTHPVMTTETGHFSGTDLPNASSRVEAVVDWNGRITYFNRDGVLNPTRPGTSVVEPMEYNAGFINAEGKIVGYGTIRWIDLGNGQFRVDVK